MRKHSPWLLNLYNNNSKNGRESQLNNIYHNLEFYIYEQNAAKLSTNVTLNLHFVLLYFHRDWILRNYNSLSDLMPKIMLKFK